MSSLHEKIDKIENAIEVYEQKFDAGEIEDFKIIESQIEQICKEVLENSTPENLEKLKNLSEKVRALTDKFVAKKDDLKSEMEKLSTQKAANAAYVKKD